MKIIIVGAGLGGLTAAYCFARDGHLVDVFEKRASFVPKGGGIMIRHSASQLLREWGLGADFESISDEVEATLQCDGTTGEVFHTAFNEDTGGGNWSTFRKEVQEVLHRRGLEKGVRFHFGVTVTNVSETGGSALVYLSTGEAITANLVLLADGILSPLRQQIIPSAPPPMPGGSTVNQIIVSEEELLADPDARLLLETGDSHLRVWISKDGGEYVVGRYKKTLKKFSSAFGIAEVDANDPKLWDEHGDLELVRERFAHFHRSLTGLLRIAKSCDRWRLAEMPDLPRWASESGTLILLGDSAHAMFPDAAFGYSSIVEDIGTLSYLFAHHGHLEVRKIVNVWLEIRMPRVNRLKAWARKNHEVYTTKASPSSQAAGNDKRWRSDASGTVVPDMSAEFTDPAFLKWAYEYDVFSEVERVIQAKGGHARQFHTNERTTQDLYAC